MKGRARKEDDSNGSAHVSLDMGTIDASPSGKVPLFGTFWDDYT
jgi:hypothetical protein